MYRYQKISDDPLVVKVYEVARKAVDDQLVATLTGEKALVDWLNARMDADLDRQIAQAEAENELAYQDQVILDEIDAELSDVELDLAQADQPAPWMEEWMTIAAAARQVEPPEVAEAADEMDQDGVALDEQEIYEVEWESADEPEGDMEYLDRIALVERFPWVESFIEGIRPDAHFQVVIRADHYVFSITRKLY